MRNVLKIRNLVLLGTVAAAAMLLAPPENATARPQYKNAFIAKYPKVAAAAKKANCNVCHVGKNKKMRNDYGTALMKNTGKNQKDKNKIDEALVKTGKAKKPGTEKTFEDIINSGKLPAAESAE